MNDYFDMWFCYEKSSVILSTQFMVHEQGNYDRTGSLKKMNMKWYIIKK